MNRFLFFLLCYLFFAEITAAQSAVDSTRFRDSLFGPDTAMRKDSLPVSQIKDAVSKRPGQDSDRIMNPVIQFSSPPFTWQILQQHPYFGFKAEASIKKGEDTKQVYGKELLFYGLVFLLIIYALIRLVFPKYFSDLFRLFFRTTLNQRQIREQLMQAPLPSLLLNVFFVISGGLYISFLLKHFKISPVDNFWLLFFYCCAGLSAAYFVKFLGLKISGWLFNMQEAANAYIFIVFIINKMIGILLLPFLVILAFGVGNVYSAGMTISFCLVAGLLAYRFILTYATTRNQVKVNPFHFFLYLCAFEIAPLLLVYKGLLLFFSRTA